EQEANERVQHAHSDRDSKGVVAKGADQILADVPHSHPTDLNRRDDTHQAAFDQGNIASLDSDIRSCTNCKPHVRLSKGRRIVDAIADHAYRLSLEMKFRDFVRLIIGKNLGENAFDADLPRDGAPHALVVAGEHHDLEAKCLKRINGSL